MAAIDRFLRPGYAWSAAASAGMALPTALFAMIASMALASAAVISSVDVQQGTDRDHDSKKAIAAADAGANIALLRHEPLSAAASTRATPAYGDQRRAHEGPANRRRQTPGARRCRHRRRSSYAYRAVRSAKLRAYSSASSRPAPPTSRPRIEVPSTLGRRESELIGAKSVERSTSARLKNASEREGRQSASVGHRTRE